MIEEEGIVVKYRDGKALVKTDRTSACEGCASVEVCQPAVDDNQMIVEAENPLGARRGDKVLIAIGTRELLGASLVLYLFPLIFFVLGVLLGELAGETIISWVNKDLLAFLSGFIMLIVAFAVVRTLWGRWGKDSLLLPRIVRVL